LISLLNGKLQVNFGLAVGRRLEWTQTPAEGFSPKPAAFRMSFAAELTVLITVPEGIIPFLHQFVGEASRGQHWMISALSSRLKIGS